MSIYVNPTYTVRQKKVTCKVRKRPGMDLRGADQELCQMLRKRLSSLDKGCNTFMKVEEIHEMPRDQSKVIFILCPFTCRLASDVSTALEGILSQKNIILVVFRSIAPHIPLCIESKEVLIEQKHKDLGDIVDVIVSGTGGRIHLNDCEQNHQAVSRICKFIQHFYPWK